jgi:mono/diheme cytochrome c family protein
LAAGAEVSSKEKYERCAKVAGEVVYTVVHYLNEYFEGRWKPAKWTPSPEITHCIECHGPEGYLQYGDGMNQQQGHMECLLCHKDHMKALLNKRAKK